MTGVRREAPREGDIRPYAPEAWIDHTNTKIGYEIPFTRHFYEYVPPRPLAAIDAELLEAERVIQSKTLSLREASFQILRPGKALAP